MTGTDYTQRFLFEHTSVRGERVYLKKELEAVLSGHDYPCGLKKLLGEMVSATILLRGILKFSGTFTLQARSSGPATLLMVECTDQMHFRAVARWKKEQQPDRDNGLLHEWLPDGQIVITIDPEKGNRYQSIVILEHSTLAECITAYFRQSEQLPTKLWLASNGSMASGLLLQSLPDESHPNSPERRETENQWEHLAILAETVTTEELLELDNPVLLQRLFHESDIKVFDPVSVSFQCTCSRQRTLQALKNISTQEIRSILDEKGYIDMQCQFCNRQYHYTTEDAENFLKEKH